MSTTTDPIATAEHAYGLAGRAIAGVRPDQLDDPTPCSEWNVRALVNHMIGGQMYFTSAVRGEPFDMNGELPDFTASDAAGTYSTASQAMLATWREPGALDRTVETFFGTFPATVMLGMMTTESLVHAWDLARATAQGEDLDPNLAAGILAMLRQQEMPRGEGAPFQPERPAPEGATPEQQLAAFLGREV